MTSVSTHGTGRAGHVEPGLCAAIGRTPLLRLRELSAATGCEILVKAEFLNPGGSIKDRAALELILDAERRGALTPGGTIVEATAGNTGIGLALVGRARGYRNVAVVPEDVSPEKIELLRAIGSEVQLAPDVPSTDPRFYANVAPQLARQIRGGWWPNQFDNTANRAAHYRTTGPEIWEQTEGRLTAFVASVGSGGTLAGTAQFLKERNPAIRTVCADPHGASIWSWVKFRHVHATRGDSIAEGIGQNRVTRNIADAPIDDAYQVSDRVAVEMLHYLLRAEGLFVGLSSAINVCGAVRLARERGPGQVIVTVLCDGGARYASRLFRRDWLAARDLAPCARHLEFLGDLAAENLHGDGI